MSEAGDVNGDGFDDLLVGALLATETATGQGIARILSGKDGSILFSFRGDGTGDRFGVVATAGDVNGDGLGDIIVGARLDDNNGSDSGSARILSGADGSILLFLTGDSAGDVLGGSVSGGQDVNGDGTPDVIAGARGDAKNGALSGGAFVFSGLDGSLLYLFSGDSVDDQFGFSVSMAGDLNGDGFADMIVGAPFDDNNGADSGIARVFSGFDGSILYTFVGDAAGYRLGTSVSEAGDVNGDGFDDVIVGASGNINSGSARVFSGFDGSIQFTFNGDAGDLAADSLGTSPYFVDGAGDVNGDGFDDLIVGFFGNDNNGVSAGTARVHSGLDGSVLFSVDGELSGDQFGRAVSRAGDVNGDGLDDVIVGAPGKSFTTTDPGSAHVFSFGAGSVDSDGDGLLDDQEIICGTDPSNPDSDGDGLLDGTEFDLAGGCEGCPDPLDDDSDGDTLLDGHEVLVLGTDPCNLDLSIAIGLYIDELQAIIDAEVGTPLADKLGDAVASLETASEELNKEPPDSQAAVGNIEGAVGSICDAVSDEGLDPVEGAALMDNLAGIARQLAVDAIDEAIAVGGDAGEIQEAMDFLAEADSLRELATAEMCELFRIAISAYKDALAKAEGALP